MIPETSPTKENGFKWTGMLLWIALALIIRWQVIEPRWIPSGSMIPTLQINDRILVEKISPKFKNWQQKVIKRGTVVVFRPPSSLINAGYDPNKALIKRIIGLPGDLIEIHNGELFINGQISNENWRKGEISYEMDKIQVPKDQLWVLGDNRNLSLDSHIWGSLPIKNVIGTAIWRYWPIKSFGKIRFPDQKNI